VSNPGLSRADSLIVVGEPSIVRVHLHTDDHEAVLAACAATGRVARTGVADMWRQAAERRAAPRNP
jgi:dihydroxyacetone kinase-like predicted kinase